MLVKSPHFITINYHNDYITIIIKIIIFRHTVLLWTDAKRTMEVKNKKSEFKF